MASNTHYSMDETDTDKMSKELSGKNKIYKLLINELQMKLKL